MRILSGKDLRDRIEQEIAEQVARLTDAGVQPQLQVVKVGDDPVQATYIRNKAKACERVGMLTETLELPASISQEELDATIERLNADRSVHGILCQLPLPGHLDADHVIERIDPLKDVDCFHPYNVGCLTIGRPRFMPCTPAGIMVMCERYEVPVAGRHVVVLGRSNIVGRPLSILMSHKGIDATVTVCHSRTPNVPEITRSADILVAAIGKPEWVIADMVREGATVIDVGVHRVPDETRKSGYRLCGDVDYQAVAGKTEAISPVPGGVGPMTITMLLQNTLTAARLQHPE